MPTNRTRKARNRRPDISPTRWARLNDEPMPENPNEWELFILNYPTQSRKECGNLWTQYREEIIDEWCETKPGMRPSYWWIFDAPRLPEEQHGDYAGCFFAPDLIVPRMRLGGKGTPTHEVLAYVPDFDLGVPENWTSDSDISCYKHDRTFRAERFDPLDPPCFESQATYLRRMEILTPGENRALRNRTAAFAPEVLPRRYWPA